VAAESSLPAEVRLYDHLFGRPDPGADGDYLADINPQSLETLTGCRLEPSLRDFSAGQAVQFERLGYFCPDPDATPARPVFNRTIGLRDSWAKVAARE
jgi:glutaminyl-tRNA synthetase